MIGPPPVVLVPPQPQLSKAAKKNAKRREKRDAAAQEQTEEKPALQQHSSLEQHLASQNGAVDDPETRPCVPSQDSVDDPETCARQEAGTQVRWPRRKFVPLAAEQHMMCVLLQHKKERGMMRAQPPFRILEVRDACNRNDVTMDQALSLRRHHIRNNHKCPNQEQVVELGTEVQIREAAALFEEAIANHLDAAGVSYLTEAAQRTLKKSLGQQRPTPDFLLPTPLTVREAEALEASWTHQWRCDASDGVMYTQAEFVQYYARDGERAWAAAQHRAAHPGGPLHWIEAKHFFGPSTIRMDGKSAAGKLVAVVDKYVRLFGPGAIVFSEGCGEALAAELEARGALVLDSTPLDLGRVHQQMATWCAGPAFPPYGGELLP